MDDGSWKSDHHNTYIIHTVGYEKSDLELLKKALEELANSTIDWPDFPSEGSDQGPPLDKCKAAYLALSMEERQKFILWLASPHY